LISIKSQFKFNLLTTFNSRRFQSNVFQTVISKHIPGKMAYKSEDEITGIIRAFENGTISRSEWRHNEHLTVAFYYALHHDFETALIKMRVGIFNLLNAFGVDLSKEMPYHETLTVFWMRTVFDFCESKNAGSVVGMCNELIEKFDKDYPFRFYSREFLFSDQARTSFVAADLEKSSAAD